MRLLRLRRMSMWAGLLALALCLPLALGACGPAAEPPAGDEVAMDADPNGNEVDGMDAEAETEADPESDPEAEADPEAPGDEAFAPGEGSLVLYSGRGQDLVAPLLEDFEAQTGIEVEVRWGSTPELAATLLEEGEASPADLFFAQDPGGLGAVSDMLAPLPEEILEQVDARYRDPDGRWVGLSGRARVVVYNTERVAPEELPASLQGFTEAIWRGRIGWAPTNSSFQTMLTAMRELEGEEAALAWVEGMVANEAVAYESNTSIVAAVGAGEVDAGLVNHYYLQRFLAEEGEDFDARNHFMPGQGAGSLVMVAGAGILQSAEQPQLAEQLLDFLLGSEAQRYFATETYEYPLALGSATEQVEGLPPIDQLAGPDIPLSDLADLPGTADLLQEAGALP